MEEEEEEEEENEQKVNSLSRWNATQIASKYNQNHKLLYYLQCVSRSLRENEYIYLFLREREKQIIHDP